MTISMIKNSVYDTANYVRENLPTPVSGQQMLKNVQNVAIPALMLAGAIHLNTANAGPVTEASCLIACGIAAATPWGIVSFPIWMDKCIAACMMLGVLPTP